MEGAPRYAGMTGQKLSLSISTVATCGFLLFGYDQGIMSGIISAKPFNDVFPATRDNATMQGFVTAIYEIGCLAGAMSIIWAGDVLGRRKSIMLGATIMILGVIIQVTSFPGHDPLAQFIVGRVITGVGNGMNTSTIPTYQAECSRTSNRGLLICIEGGVIAFGTLISYWIDFGASYGPDDLTWRFPIAFQVVFGVFIVVGMWFMPESPRSLCMHDKFEEGERVIAALQGKPVSHNDVQLQKTIVLDSIRASGEGGKAAPLSAVFSNGKTQHFRRMLLGVSSQIMQQIGGCNAVIYYFPILFEKSIHQTHTMSMLLGGVNMIIYSIFATTSWFLIERVGRRKLFLYGTVGQCLSMVLTFSCLIPGTESAAKGAAVGLFTYIASFGATWLPLPWLYPAEISPIKTRAKANALSTCSNWLFNFTIVMITPVMLDGIGWGTYLFFAVVNACFLPIIYFFYPETARRSLEEIDLIFAKGFTENTSYVAAAKNLPYLSEQEIREMMIQYGLASNDGSLGAGSAFTPGSEIDGEKHGAEALEILDESSTGSPDRAEGEGKMA
ncbi:Sugar transporter family protein [Coccidioides posadasii C735 delta SOWgp]|uniref:Sugar transporter family protein n=1 Tax=Coccidioides posadasii (strain C735) TaxID=222929 RepID=C5PCA1_COCP7|nr:Sugar transporter family protein [Coccidioides posadasii C735 delta SOWgp]EER25578.1 Sugar transporter family protein [Coccidioides posadasii C735 delta SOWgp]|eukprot:XP_003067723.1 Sugar transporter family protein [Coccidioides posadasii C735 delta SOWgp]